MKLKEKLSIVSAGSGVLWLAIIAPAFGSVLREGTKSTFISLIGVVFCFAVAAGFIYLALKVEDTPWVDKIPRCFHSFVLWIGIGLFVNASLFYTTAQVVPPRIPLDPSEIQVKEASLQAQVKTLLPLFDKTPEPKIKILSHETFHIVCESRSRAGACTNGEFIFIPEYAVDAWSEGDWEDVLKHELTHCWITAHHIQDDDVHGTQFSKKLKEVS